MPDAAKQQVIDAPQTKDSFEDYLLQSGKVDRKKLAQLSIKSRTSGKDFIDTLVKNKIISEEELTRIRGEFYSLTYVDLQSYSVPREILDLLPQSAIAMYKFVPFAFDGKILKVAITDPTNLTALEALDFFAQKKHYIVEIYITSIAGFQHAISQSKDLSREVGLALEDIAEREKAIAEKREKQLSDKTKESEKVISEAPISKIVDVIVKHAIEEKASDIHIEPGEHDLRVRYRIDGVLQNSLVVPKSVHPAIVSRIKILSNLKIDETRLPQDGRFHLQMGKVSVDFRVSTLPTVNGEKVVLRILDKSSGVPTLDDLGIWGRKKALVEDSLKISHGMVLVTGPTGSGKSTTLSSVLTKLNKISVNIVTLEDPVEYYIEGVNQSQVKPEIGMTFASGLRSILRQDPNIVMVGEIRDKETAELAVHAALTGHLVFSTLHTNDAVGAIPRLIDMGVDHFLVVASLNLVVAQRLVRKLCLECRKPIVLPEESAAPIRKDLEIVPKTDLESLELKKLKVFQAKGCNACGGTGYKGRLGIYEVLQVSKAIQDLIMEKESGQKLYEQASKEGFVTMKQDGYIKALQGHTTIEEVIRVTKT